MKPNINTSRSTYIRYLSNWDTALLFFKKSTNVPYGISSEKCFGSLRSVHKVRKQATKVLFHRNGGE